VDSQTPEISIKKEGLRDRRKVRRQMSGGKWKRLGFLEQGSALYALPGDQTVSGEAWGSLDDHGGNGRPDQKQGKGMAM